MQPKVSIIVPVYCAENTLRRCVDSILAQTLQEIEIILIDDGSTDNSWEICKKYMEASPKVRAYSQENKGASGARNAGLNVALGEFIGFVDSDDAVEPEMYRLLYQQAEEKQADFVGCGYKYRNDKGTWIIGPSNLPEGCYSYEQIVQLLVKPLLGNEKRVGNKGVNGYGCMGIFRREILETNQIRFQSEREIFHEDELFYFAFMKHVHRVVYLDQPLYHYYFQEGSLSHRHWNNMWEMGKRLINRYHEIAEEYGIAHECGRRIDMYLLFFVIYTTFCACLPSVALTSGERTAQIRTVFEDEETKRVFREPIVFHEPKMISFILAMAKKNHPAVVRFVLYHYLKITKRKTL